MEQEVGNTDKSLNRSTEAVQISPETLFSYSAVELAKKIKTRELTSEFVVSSYYHRMEELNPKINAIIEFNKNAIEQAKQADIKLNEAISKGETIAGLLFGVPFTVKDHIGVKSFKFTLSVDAWKDSVCDENATVVQRLLDEGGIFLGKTNMPEMGLAVETDSVVYGVCRNPYDLNHTCGGSSGGEGSIIAARGSPLGIGSDIGGSIRIPSHYNGIVGIKPSEGLLSIAGIGPLSYLGYGFLRLLLNLGPMARSIDDLELALRITSGDDDLDSRTTGKYLGDSTTIDVSTLKVAVFMSGPKNSPKISNEVLEAIKQTANRLKDAGVTIEFVEVPQLLDGTYSLYCKLLAPFHGLKGQCKHKIVEPFFDICDPEKLNIKNFEDYFKCTVELDQFRTGMLKFMKNEKFDAILSACTSTSTPLIGSASIEEIMHTVPYNLIGWPVVVFSTGLGIDSQLPVGLQIIGKAKRDDIALALARVSHINCPPPKIH